MNVSIEKDADYSDYEMSTRGGGTTGRKFSISREPFGFDGSASETSEVDRTKDRERDNSGPNSRTDGDRKRSLQAAGIDILIGSDDESPATAFHIEKDRGYSGDDDVVSIRSSSSRGHKPGVEDARDHIHHDSHDHGHGHGPYGSHDRSYDRSKHDDRGGDRDRDRDRDHDRERDHDRDRDRDRGREHDNDYDARSEVSYHERRYTPDEINQQKREILFQFERLEKKGCYFGKRFTMDSSLDEMKYEYEKLKNQRDADSAVKFYRNVLMAFVSGAEYVNDTYSPYRLKLNGWSESVIENIDGYDDVFEELHQKYKNKIKVAPELKLLGLVVGSGFMCHLTNSVFKSSSMPEMGDIMKDNPDLMRQFQAAAVNTAQRQNPAMGGMFEMMNSIGANIPTGPPPPVSARQSPPQSAAPVQRREMQGPSNIDDILTTMGNGLQTPRQQQTPVQQSQTPAQRPSPSPQRAPQFGAPINTAEQPRKDEDVRSINLSEMNEFDRVSEMSSLDESMIKEADLKGMSRSFTSRPGMGIRPTQRDAILNKIRAPRKRVGKTTATIGLEQEGLVIEI